MFCVSRILILCSLFLLFQSCCTKPVYKSFDVISKGDTKEDVIRVWGKPDKVHKDDNNTFSRELWVYECPVYVGCEESECYFDAPCYILLFEDKRLVQIHNATLR